MVGCVVIHMAFVFEFGKIILHIQSAAVVGGLVVADSAAVQLRAALQVNAAAFLGYVRSVIAVVADVAVFESVGVIIRQSTIVENTAALTSFIITGGVVVFDVAIFETGKVSVFRIREVDAAAAFCRIVAFVRTAYVAIGEIGLSSEKIDAASVAIGGFVSYDFDAVGFGSRKVGFAALDNDAAAAAFTRVQI